jgi:nucleotide-binding universal stress UspA family protein
MFKNILVPTDGSEYSHETVRKAVTFAKEIGASLTAFYAIPERRMPYYVNGMDVRNPGEWQGDAADERRAGEILSFVEKRCEEEGVACSRRIATSSVVYEAIIAAADEAGCDLIFMASHGRSGLGAVLLGSETIKVLTHSTIPVLVCR